MNVDLNCLDPGNVHLNNLKAPVLNVLNNAVYALPFFGFFF